MIYEFFRRLPHRRLNFIIFLNVLIGIMELGMPVISRYTIDEVLPNERLDWFGRFILALIVIQLTMLGVHLIQQFLLIKLEIQAERALQSMLWERLLGLSPAFFRAYTPGDLTQRIFSLSQLRNTVSDAMLMAIFETTFAIFSLGLMLFYDTELALLILLLGITASSVTAYLGRYHVRYQAEWLRLEGQHQNYTAQIIAAIEKLRLARAENRIFEQWAAQWERKQHLIQQIRRLNRWQVTLFSIYPIVGAMLLFSQAAQMTLGTFVAFNMAAGQFLGGLLAINQSAFNLLSLLPLYQRVTPIFQIAPEGTDKDTVQLSGQLEVHDLSFRYHDEQPYIVKNISFVVKKGEFIAIVGKSGSGKSSLLRLLLGFEPVPNGTIFYDGCDLNTLNLKSLRQQIGVVLQNSQPIYGENIRNAITGITPYTDDQVWEALRIAELAEEVQAMPMGIHTMIGEGGVMLSSGQRQRLLITGAVIRKPILLFLDEAMSAVDQQRQLLINQNLAALNITRLMISHQPEVIQSADQVLMLS